jgi:hypothetical protein
VRRVPTTRCAAVFIVCGVTLAQSPFTFKGADGHFTIVMPANWRETTRDEIDQYAKLLKQATGADLPAYEAGFHLSGSDPFDLPYILVERPTPKTSYEDLKKQWSDGMLDDPRKDLNGKVSAVIGAPRSKSIRYLDLRHAVVTEMEAPRNDGVVVRMMSASYAGKAGVVSAYFYADKSSWGKYSDEFEGILDSFNYEPGYEYNAAAATGGNHAQSWARVVAVAILGAVWAYFRNRKKKRGAEPTS